MEAVRHEALRDELVRRFGVAPGDVRLVLAPYRICPLGAHIDHQLGRVTALALDRGVALAYAPRPEPAAVMQSLDFPGEVRVDFNHIEDKRPGDWGNYLRGAVRALQQSRRLTTGLVGLTAGGIAEGGLSSSAAVGVAYLLALEDADGLAVSVEENIRLDQYIENSYLGLRNGVLDQAAILLGRRNALTLIDCRTLTHEWIVGDEALGVGLPTPPNSSTARSPGAPETFGRISGSVKDRPQRVEDRPQRDSPFSILIAFSGLRQALVGTDYNRRVGECREAAATLLNAAGRPDAEPLLGNVSAEEYATHGHALAGGAARRAAHFFGEMDRVARGVAAWRHGDLATFGQLVTASGQSSIENYECGAPPLVDLYQILVATAGVYGARFSGAGFRGCCMALVAPERAQAIAAEVRRAYAAKHPDLAPAAQVLVCHSGDGARVVEG